MVEAVTFDWWHTLAEVTPGYDARLRDARLRGIRAVLSDTGFEADGRALREAYDRQTEWLQRSWRDLRDRTPDEQIAGFLTFAGLGDLAGTPVADRLKTPFGEAILAEMPVLEPHAADALRDLRRDGYRIGLISNTGRTWGRYLREVKERLGIRDAFDVLVYSDEARARKPDRAIFEIALRELGTRPGEVVHIGDDATADVEGARAAGMGTIWYNRGFWDGVTCATMDREVRGHDEVPGAIHAWPR